MTDADRDKRIRHGRQAREFLDSDLCKEVFADMRADLVNKMLATKGAEPIALHAQRDALINEVNAIDSLVQKLKQIVFIGTQEENRNRGGIA